MSDTELLYRYYYTMLLFTYKNLIPTNYNNTPYTIINTPYNWPAFLTASCLNIGYMSSYELKLEYVTNGHIATHTILL